MAAAASPADSEATSQELLVAVITALESLGSQGEPVSALRESFARAARSFRAEKALLLYVRRQEPLLLESVEAVGDLTPEQIEACIRGQSVKGVSPSVVRKAIEARKPQLVENALAASPTVTASLKGHPYSILCTPVIDPWTSSVLAVLYFQTTSLARTYSTKDLRFLAGYATTLGHAFGLFLSGVKRHAEAAASGRGGKDAPDILGDSEEMARLRRVLHETYIPATASQEPDPLLILGETGTGKDLVAQYLHYYSPSRSKARFVAFNCATLRNNDLSQAILFGHTKGAFTGASEAKPGLFRSANHGTLFLDEVGELSIDAQSLLFRALSSRRVLPLGAADEVAFDVQLILATNRDLAAAVREGSFRQELYQRIKPLTIRLTPLAARPGDIRPLLTHFLALHEKRLRKRTQGLSREALRLLLGYAWPGNVRELGGVCSALVTHAAAGSTIEAADIEAHCPEIVSGPRNPAARLLAPGLEGSFRAFREQMEREFLVSRLQAVQWNVAEAAQSLGLSVPTLYRYLQRYGLRQTVGPGG
jgi:DNA-binding NtrC family response regulator